MKSRMSWNGAILFLVMAFDTAWTAETEGPQDKSRYHFFNPTPSEITRDISTDRPDKTESPYTIDAGHYQLEASFLDYSTDRHNPEGSQIETKIFNIMPANLKIGLLNDLDLQLTISPYIKEKTQEEVSAADIKTGFGDIQTRLKFNLWGNDEGKTALAVMPFIKFPTNGANLGNDNVEGGLIVPLSVELSKGWSLGLMMEFDARQNSADENYHTEFINSVTFGHQMIGRLKGYAEFFSNISDENNADWIATVDAGLTYTMMQDIQIDGGVNIGVTKAADDLNPFCGLSVRY